MKLVFLGPPGAGKGTQAVRVCEEYGIVHLSTGDMLRTEITNKSQLGELANEYIHKGQLVPDDVVIEMVRQRLKEQDAQKGFILDGFPRTVNQAIKLDEITDIDCAVDINVSDELLMERISGRRICINCKTAYSHAENKNGLCKKCGHKLYIRDDDRPEIVVDRLKVYAERTMPIIDYYNEQGKLAVVDGNGTVDETYAEVKAALEKVKAR